MVLSTEPKRARSNFETVVRRFRCDASAMLAVILCCWLEQFEMHLRSGMRFAVKRVFRSAGPFGPYPVADAKGAAEWAGKAKQRLCKHTKKKVNFSSSHSSTRLQSWTDSSCAAFIGKPVASSSLPTLMNRVRPGWRRQWALSVCQDRLTFFFLFFCPTRFRSVAPWQTASFYFFYFLFFQFACLVKSDTDKERLGERSWRAV